MIIYREASDSSMPSLKPKIDILYKTDWLSLRKISAPNMNIEGYIYSHEDRCGGHIVSILPFRKVDEEFEFLLRQEVTPCWSLDQMISSITGGVDPGMDPIAAALQEMIEEAGYKLEDAAIIALGTIRGSKSSDTLYHIFGVDVTGMTAGPALGDGTESKKDRCVWVKDISLSVDPLSYVALIRLVQKSIVTWDASL
jgi:hypothetical protein